MSTPTKSNGKRGASAGVSPALKKGVGTDLVLASDVPVVVEVPPWFIAFESRIIEKFSDLSGKIDEVTSLAQSAKYEAQQAQSIAEDAQQRIKEVEKIVNTMQEEFFTKAELKEMLKKTSPQTESIAHEDETRDQEVIVHGYNDDTDFKTIEANLNKIIKDLELESRVEKALTFADPSSIGVIRFKTVPAKFGLQETETLRSEVTIWSKIAVREQQVFGGTRERQTFGLHETPVDREQLRTEC